MSWGCALHLKHSRMSRNIWDSNRPFGHQPCISAGLVFMAQNIKQFFMSLHTSFCFFLIWWVTIHTVRSLHLHWYITQSLASFDDSIQLACMHTAQEHRQLRPQWHQPPAVVAVFFPTIYVSAVMIMITMMTMMLMVKMKTVMIIIVKMLMMI